MTKYHYGLESKEQAIELAKNTAVVLGHGKNRKATELLLETACAETQLGTYPDRYKPEGFGLHQFDTIGFEDVVARTRRVTKDLVKLRFGYDLDALKPQDLENDPRLSFVMCRLKYRLIPEPIPSDIFSRAHYWKKHYNTVAGKGTFEHYLESAERILYAEKDHV